MRSSCFFEQEALLALLQSTQLFKLGAQWPRKANVKTACVCGINCKIRELAPLINTKDKLHISMKLHLKMNNDLL